MAITSGLLDVTIDGARGILFSITGGSDLTLFEVNEAAAIIKDSAHQECNLIFGAHIDESMGDEVHITVIATGFERSRLETTMKEAGTSAHPSDDAALPQAFRQSNVPMYEDVEVQASSSESAAASSGGSALPVQRSRLAPPSPPQEDPRTYDNIDPKNTELPAFLA